MKEKTISLSGKTLRRGQTLTPDHYFLTYRLKESPVGGFKVIQNKYELMEMNIKDRMVIIRSMSSDITHSLKDLLKVEVKLVSRTTYVV